MSKKIKNEQKKFLGETLNQYDKALDEGINQLDKKNREQNHKISSLVNSFDNEYLEKDVEGNMTTLENSKDGMVIINEIQGSTEVNYCKDGEKELILNGDIDTQGESFVTITEGVDGGLVDVSLEGNTEINLSKTKDPVLVTREFDDINCNTGKLQYTIDDVTTINDEPGKVDIDRIVGDTMVNHAVNGSEELILNAHINESGDNNITLNGVTSDGGKVDVALEGNTLVNVSKTKNDYITPSIEDKVDKGSVISLPEVSEGYINIDEIQGNTLVNYCTDGVKELTLNGDIDVEGNFVTTTEGVDNGLVDVVCEGNTLVNHIAPLSKSWYVGGSGVSGVSSNINGNYILGTKTSEGSFIVTADNNIIATNKSTTYSLIFNVKQMIEVSDSVCMSVHIRYNDGEYWYVGKINKGLNKLVFTTKDKDLINSRIVFGYTEVFPETGTLEIGEIMLLEGDWTDKEIPKEYFEGMKSVGQDDVNGHKVEILSNNNGSLSNISTHNFDTDGNVVEHTLLEPIKPGESFKVCYTNNSSKNTALGLRFHYPSETRFGAFGGVGSHSRIFTNIYDETLTSISTYRDNNYDGLVIENFSITKVKNIEDTSFVDYKPYQSNKKEISLNEPLRSLPNGVKDRFVKIGDKWFIERKCAELVVNTSMQGFSFQYWNGSFDTDNLYAFYLYNGELFGTNPNGLKYRDGRPIICDKFPYIPGGTTSTASGVWSGLVSSPLYIGFKLPKNIIDNCEGGSVVEKGRNYLKSIGDMKFIVEYINPIYEPLEIEPTLNTYNDTTHISNNSIIPCNMKIKNTGYNAIIKPSTLYTVALDTDKSGTIGINLDGAKVTTTNNVATITTPSTLTDDSLRLYGKGIKASKVRLLEGDKTNWIPGFFEGMKSSFEDKVQEDNSYKMEILMNNENLLSVDLVENGTDRTETPHPIYFKKGHTYMFAIENCSVGCQIFLMKHRGYPFAHGENDEGVIQIINDWTNPKDKFVFTAKQSGYFYIQTRGEEKTILQNPKAIVSENINATYTPQKSNKVQLSSIEPLRGVGDVYDRLVFKDSKLMIERNCRQENMSELKFAGDTSDTMKCLILFKSKPKAISNIFSNSRGYESATKGQMYVQERGNGMTYLWIPTDPMSREEFTNFLNEKNATIVYAKEEPTYEEIPYELQKIILKSYTNGTLFFDTNIPPTKVSFNCFEEELTYLYPSTSYTVQFNSDRVTTADLILGGTQLLAQDIVQGLNRISITTPTTLTDNKLIINGVGANIREIVVTDTDREFRYFESMKSVGECEELEILSANSDNTLSNTQQLTHEPLRAVGAVKDRYVLLDSKWYIERNTYQTEVSLDNGFIINITRNNDNCYIQTDKNNLKIPKYYYAYGGSVHLNCNKYKGVSNDYLHGSSMDVIGITVDGFIRLVVSVSKITGMVFDDDSKREEIITKIQEWLNNQDIKIVYKLLTPQYEEIDYNPLEVYSDVTHISVNSSIPCNLIIKNHGYNLVALKENTQYTLYVNKDTTNALTYRLGDYVEINSPSKFTFTTPSTLTDKTLRIDGKGTKVNDLMLIEGTPTNDSVGYFDGLKSSYECERVTDENDENYGKYKVDIKVVGKNLFDINKLYKGYTITTDGSLVTTTNPMLATIKLDVSNLQGHTLVKSGGNRGYYRIEDNKNNIVTSGNSTTITIPIGSSILYWYVSTNKDDTIQIEEGDTATEYEPYFESKQTIYLNSPLLKGDEIVWKDNKIQHYHKMKTVIFDGSDDEKWINFGINANNAQPNTAFCEIKTDGYTSKGICDSYKIVMNDIWGKEEYDSMKAISFCSTGGNPGKIQILIPKSYLTTLDIIGFRNYLNQNPITVVYELATPYYEEISDYPLKLNAIANSSLSTESTIQVTNISFNVYEETLPYLYSNTKYYITFNADVDRNNIIIDLGGNHVVFDCKVGFNKVEITTPSDTTNLLTFSGTGVNIDHVKVTQQDIDEYFEGMKSVGECEDLEITSANSDNTLLNTQQLTHEPLRAVGEVKDRYVLIDNKWYIERRCGEIALENIQWEYNSTITNSGNTFAYTGGIDNILVQSQVTKNYFLCNIVEATKVHNHEVDKEQITQFIHSSGIALRISRDKLQDNSVNSLNEFLLNNNAKLVYQLKTPVYEPIDYNPFETYADITHITTNSLIPSNMVIKNHGYNCILKPSTTYTIALNKPNGTISAKLGGSAKVDSTNSIFTITTPSTLNDNVLRLSGSGNVKDIMILEGDKTVNTPSYFEGIESGFEQEYDTEKGKYRVTARVEGNGKESSITFYLNEPLRGTGTAKDKVFIQDSKVVVQRNCGSVTFDGSEGIMINSINDKTIEFHIHDSINKTINNIICICNTIPYKASGTDERVTPYATGIYVTINKNKLNTQDVEGFKQWLQDNPTTIVYQLAEPTYEEADCDLSKLVLENYENSSLVFESNIPVSANIRYSGEVPVVTQAKTLSSKVDNTTLDINENIIPYMCDIDYRIVELQLMNGDTQGEDIELLGIGDIEILGNENVLFNNREDKKHNYSYDMLKRDILSQRYSKEEYQYRLDRYLLANKISNEEYKELEGLLNNGK